MRPVPDRDLHLAQHEASFLILGRRDSTGSSGNRPGWRIADSAINRQAVRDARARYLSDLQSAYKNPSTGFGVQGAIGSQEGQPCTCRNAEYPEYFGAPGHLRNGVCVSDRADAAPDETDPRKRRVWEEPDEDDDDDADEEAEAVSDDDAPPFGAGDRRTVDQIAHEHRIRTDRLLADHARWLSEQWKTGK